MFVITADFQTNVEKDYVYFTHEFSREGENRTMFVFKDPRHNATFISVDWIQNGK